MQFYIKSNKEFCVSLITEEYNEIWVYVEKNMKILIPKYIKCILTYCGYNDCHTIATIEETDLGYFINEVRQGKVTNFFRKLGINNALEGSTKSAENFEFSRGHQKLLMIVVGLVKQNLNDYGADIFTAELTKMNKNTRKNKTKDSTKDYLPRTTNGRTNKPMKETKLTMPTIITLDRAEVSQNDLFLKPYQKICVLHEDIIKHQTTLLTKAVSSLSIHTPKMYQEVSTRIYANTLLSFLNKRIRIDLAYSSRKAVLFIFSVACRM